ncbi:MAG: glycosyltransferase family 1 protein [Vicinamibacteria bacterium]
MRIGFDVSQTGAGKAGCGFFADSLVQAMAAQDAVNEYVLYPAFGTGWWDPDHVRTTRRLAQPNFRRGPEGMSRDACVELWRHPPADLEARLGAPDVVHANNYFCPRGLAHARTVYTLYDLVPLDHPEYLTEANRLVCFDGLFEASLRADLLLAISQSSRARFLAHFPHVPPDRVRVVYPSSRFEDGRPPRAEAAPPGLRPDGFFLSVGTLEPRKNLRRLLAAYARVAADTDLPLVLAGGRGWLEDGLEAYVASLGLQDRVRVLGYVDDETLRWLYAGCFAFVYPSLVEGFGLPVLEAMSLGAAVVTSDRSSLPEVAGDAALAVDPGDEAALAAALRRLVAEPGLRDALRALSRTRARTFSWAAAARQTLELYRDARALPPRAAASGQP